MKKYYGYCILLAFVLYGYCEEDDITVADEEEENVTVFIPTNQWQQILPGQAIPAGLHVRINLATGEKEAKLIEEDEDDEDKLGDRRRLHHYGYSDRRGIINKQTKAFTAEELLEGSHEHNDNDIKLLTHDMSTDKMTSIQDDPNAYRNDVDNDKMLGLVTDDVRQMMKLVDILHDNSSSSEELTFALAELEYLVHEINNARELDMIGGLKLVVSLLEHTNDTVQCNAAHVIGAAAQSNQVVQEACIKYGVLGYLTAIIATSDKLELLYRRTIYALSALLRLSNDTLYDFTFGHHGFDVISNNEFMQRSNRYHLKVVTLVADLLSQEAERCSGTGEEGWFLNYLTASGWCEMISHLLPISCIEQHGFMLCEAVIKAMLLLESCDYGSEVELLEKVKDQFHHVIHNADDKYSEAFDNVVKLLQRIAGQQVDE